MKEYLKILISTLLSLTILSTILALANTAFGNTGGGKGFVVPYFIAVAGFFMFGITGSITWYASLKFASAKLKNTVLIQHLVSVLIAVVVSYSAVSIYAHGLKLSGFISSWFYLIFLVPVAGFSFIIHWVVFLRRST